MEIKKPPALPRVDNEGAGLEFVRLRESDEILVNPGMGFCTAQRFNGDPVEQESRWNDDGPTEYSECPADLRNEGFPDTSVAYLRWYWMRLEPERGSIRWDIIDRAIEQAARRGQQLHFRVMSHDHGSKLPEWYKREGKLFTYQKGGKTFGIPDYSDPLFREAMERLVGQLGERYGAHPHVCAVDIGTLGLWGEWHNGAVPGNPMGDEQTRRWGIDIYLKAFPRTPLLMLIAPRDGMAYATSQGTGWRADCWGDMSEPWGHMHDFYPRAICRSGAADAWKRGPVCLETCWTMLQWHRNGWDIDYILSEALRWHATLINAKSSLMPEPWREKVAEFQKRLGYRFVLRHAGFTPEVARGGTFSLMHWWVNRGVAPCYADMRLLIRLAGEGREIDFELPHNLRAWLPGDDQYFSDSIALPSDVPPGAYELRFAIVQAGEKTPFVKMANEGRTPDAWLPVGTVSVLSEQR